LSFGRCFEGPVAAGLHGFKPHPPHLILKRHLDLLEVFFFLR
jgi:hypothetical protein